MTRPSTRPLTVLFVEDDTGVRESTAQLLAGKSIRLLVAPDANEALRLLDENPVDVLFTDIVMAGVNGIELAKEAKRLQPDLKILFMTGYYSRAAEATALGPLLYKPVRRAEVEEELEKLLMAL